MPKRTDIHKILIIGSGPIVIGQACEFDYSGTQACKALREEGYEIVLVNSNPATIMTDPDLANRTYIEPLTAEFVGAIIKRERPDALLPTVGGQTALNIAIELAESGILDEYKVEMIGAKAPAVKMAEDRLLFKQAMAEIGLDTPRSEVGQRYPRSAADGSKSWIPDCHPPVVYSWRRGRRHRVQQRGIREHRSARSRPQSRTHCPHRRIRHRMEGIRTRSDARHERQRRHHLLHRELRSDGCAHRRFRNRRACTNADGSRVSAPARCRGRRDPARSESKPAARTFNLRSIPRTASWSSSK